MEKIKESLLKMGFTQPYENSIPEIFQYENYQIKIHKNDNLESVFMKLIQMGKQLKVWEIKRVLEVIDPMS